MEVLRSRLTPYLFVLPAMGFLAVFIYAPAVENIRYSLYSWSSLSPDWKYIGLANYKALSADPIFWRALADSAIYGVISVAVQVFVALALAAVLEANVFGRRLKAFFRASLFLPSVLPVTVVALLWQLLYQPTIGLIDQLLYASGLESLSHVWLGEENTALYAVIAVSQWQWTGYMMALFMVAIKAIPEDLYEAMGLEGAGKFRQFWHLTVPGVRETTLVMTIITIYGSFKVFDIVWVMTAGGPNNASEVLGTYMYRSAFRDDVVGYASAIATVIIVITLAIGIIQIRLQRDR
jgi:raffinose/stachyose/melibiose transport system permease protein